MSASTVIVGISGCTVLTGDSDTSTPAPEECPDSPRVPETESHPKGEEPPPIPDPPESLNEKTVAAYVEDYERAYIWRRSTKRVEGGVKRINPVEATEVKSVNDGVIVEFRSIQPSGEWVNDEGNEYHFDDPRYSASYLVTEDAVWRAESEWGDQPPEPPDPRSDGTLLECY